MGQINQNFTTKDIKQYFKHSSKIFKSSQIKKGYFDQDLAFLPKNLDTIIYREEQISQLRDVFGDIVNGSKANARCYGPSGTGKTLTVNWLTHLTVELLREKLEKSKKRRAKKAEHNRDPNSEHDIRRETNRARGELYRQVRDAFDAMTSLPLASDVVPIVRHYDNQHKSLHDSAQSIGFVAERLPRALKWLKEFEDE